MLDLRFLTNQTRIHKLCHVAFQPRPPKQLLQIMIHLRSPRMNTQVVTPTLDYFNYLNYLRSLDIFIYILRVVEIKI